MKPEAKDFRDEIFGLVTLAGVCKFQKKNPAPAACVVVAEGPVMLEKS